jgi:NAD(P)-dependent dehydrogenase (short-subunit alcohol dehydrogenase family)
MDIQGKTALITGSAKRLGLAVAIELAGRGANIIIHYNHSEEEAAEAAGKIKSLGRESAALQADLTDPGQVERLAEQAGHVMGPISILVNSASVFYKTPFGQVTVDKWDDLINANVRGAFFLSQALAPQMKEQGQGKIINFSDATLPYAVADFTPYAVAKAGVEAMTRGLARALAPEVQVNAILPGPILPAEDTGDEGWQAAIKQTVLKRRGYPEDITRAVAYLIEEDFLTGVFLPVDGGRHLGR